jgi:hypothetical protein
MALNARDGSVSIFIEHIDPKARFEKASKPDMEAEAGQPYKKPGPTQLPRGPGTIGYVQSLTGSA